MSQNSIVKPGAAGKLSISTLKKRINKKVGFDLAYNLQIDNNPTVVKDWIPTGSKWLDGIICKGKWAGIPVGKISEIAGLEATGKSFLAALIAGNAQKQGIDVIYFDSESAIDPEFLSKAGVDLERLLYIQAHSVEFVLETIEELVSSNENRMLFIWDSLALTPSVSDIEGDMNPQSTMAVKARVLAKGLSKLTQPIANGQHTLLVLNQLKANITRSPAEALTTPYMTPGGKALIYAYSLRIWLTGRKAKDSYVEDENGFRIGSEVKAKIEKSRFGTQGRKCAFRILWGDSETAGVRDEESWFEAIRNSPKLTSPMKGYFEVEGCPGKFREAGWLKRLEDPDFKKAVLAIMEEEVVQKFETKKGSAKDFYQLDGEQENSEVSVAEEDAEA